MKRYLLISLLVGGLVGCPVASAGPVNTQQAPRGSITFAEKMDGPQLPGGKTCSVSVPAVGKIIQKKLTDAGCGDNVATFFKFVDVPSSTRVWLHSEKRCMTGDWIFGVKAIKHPATTSWVDIRDLDGKEDGQIVVAGMEKILGIWHSGNVKGKLSCVVISAPDA